MQSKITRIASADMTFDGVQSCLINARTIIDSETCSRCDSRKTEYWAEVSNWHAPCWIYSSSSKDGEESGDHRARWRWSEDSFRSPLAPVVYNERHDGLGMF